jgi:hypothetical protein
LTTIEAAAKQRRCSQEDDNPAARKRRRLIVWEPRRSRVPNFREISGSFYRQRRRREKGLAVIARLKSGLTTNEVGARQRRCSQQDDYPAARKRRRLIVWLLLSPATQARTEADSDRSVSIVNKRSTIHLSIHLSIHEPRHLPLRSPFCLPLYLPLHLSVYSPNSLPNYSRRDMSIYFPFTASLPYTIISPLSGLSISISINYRLSHYVFTATLLPTLHYFLVTAPKTVAYLLARGMHRSTGWLRVVQGVV